MHLKYISIKGFKSTKDKTIIDFVNGINVVVGPNGSGKSNVFDAIKWVLGIIPSAKELRVESMNDIFFDGGAKGKASSCAEVLAVFDNKDRYFNIDSDEIKIKRVLSIGKPSEYFINGESKRLKDIHALFANKGIGKNNYSIIGQGKVDKFISANPQEVKSIIEEAAGVYGYKNKKEELLLSIENFNKDLDSINILINEVEKNLKPLKCQAENYDKYSILKVELDEKSKFYYSLKLKSLESTVTTLNKSLENAKMRDEEFSEKKHNILEFVDAFKEEEDKIENSITSLETKKNNYIDEKMKMEKELVLLNTNCDNVKKDIVEQEQKIKELKKQDEEQKTCQKNFLNEIDSLKKQQQSLTSDYDDKYNKSVDIKNNLLIKNQTLSNLNKEKNKLDTDLVMLNTKVQTIRDSFVDINDNITSEQNNLKYISEKLENKKREYKKTLEQFNLFKETFNINKKLQDRLEIVENNLNYANNKNRKFDRILSIEKLLNKVDGYFGVFKNLISYDDEYDTAVKALCGGILSNFVVRDDYSAKVCIDILKKNKIPAVNFFILNKTKNTKIKSDLKNALNCIDIITSNNDYSELTAKVFTNIYICKNYDESKKVWEATSGKYKIAAKSGEIFSKNIIRGGFVDKNIKELEKEFNTLKNKLNNIVLDDKKFSNIYEIKEKINILELTSKNLSSSINSLKDKYVYSENKLKNYKNQYNLSLKKEEDYIKEINLIRNKIDKDISNINLLSNEVKELNHEENILKDEIDMLKLSINKTEVKISERDIFSSNTMDYGKEIAEVKKYIKSLESSVLKINDNINQLSSQISCIDSKVVDITNEISNLKNTLKEKRNEKDNKFQDLDKISKGISSISRTISDLENNIKSTNNFLSQLNEEFVNNDVIDVSDMSVTNIDFEEMYSNIKSLRKKIQKLGFINEESQQEYIKLKKRYEVLITNSNDLKNSRDKIKKMLQTMEIDVAEKYMNCYKSVNESYGEIFKTLAGGGNAELTIENPDCPLDSGIIIKATPPGKKNKPIFSLSGGEKAIAAVSLIFALIEYSPSPTVIFDEIDAALDEINVELVAQYIKSKNTQCNIQYIIVSHRQPMMNIAEVLYGASMSKDGITHFISQKIS